MTCLFSASPMPFLPVAHAGKYDGVVLAPTVRPGGRTGGSPARCEQALGDPVESLLQFLVERVRVGPGETLLVEVGTVPIGGRGGMDDVPRSAGRWIAAAAEQCSQQARVDHAWVEADCAARAASEPLREPAGVGHQGELGLRVRDDRRVRVTFEVQIVELKR